MSIRFFKKQTLRHCILTICMLTISLIYSKSLIGQQNTSIWGMYQGNSQHNGYVPIDIDPKTLTKAWTASVVDEKEIPGGTVYPPSIGAKYLFVARSNSGYSNTLQAFSLIDGHLAWSKDFGSLELQPIAYDNGKIFAQTLGYEFNHLNVYQEDTGELVFEVPLIGNKNQHETNTPTIDTNIVYSGSGPISGISAVEANSGKLIWSLPFNTPSNGTTSAVTDQFLLYFTGGYLYKIDKLKGVITSKIQDLNWNKNFDSPIPILLNENSGLLFNNDYLNYKLSKFNLSTNSIDFIIDEVSSEPSIDSQYIYAIKNAFLTAFDKNSGQSVWNVTSKSYGGIDNIIVTNNLIFISDRNGTTAFSKSEGHPIVWETPIHGKMVLSTKGLFIISQWHGYVSLANVEAFRWAQSQKH